jgi:hypothetical protein
VYNGLLGSSASLSGSSAPSVSRDSGVLPVCWMVLLAALGFCCAFCSLCVLFTRSGCSWLRYAAGWLGKPRIGSVVVGCFGFLGVRAALSVWWRSLSGLVVSSCGPLCSLSASCVRFRSAAVFVVGWCLSHAALLGCHVRRVPSAVRAVLLQCVAVPARCVLCRASDPVLVRSAVSHSLGPR